MYYLLQTHSTNTVEWSALLRLQTIVIIIIMENTEAGPRGLCIWEIDVKSQILVHKILYSKLRSDAMS